MDEDQGKYEEKEIHLLDYWNIIYKHRYVVLTTLIIVVAVVTIWSFMQRPTYRATAQVQIEKYSPNILPFKDVFALDASYSSYNDFYQTQYKLIQSRTIARMVIEELDLRNNKEFAGTKKKYSLYGFFRNLIPFGKNTAPQDDESKFVNAFLGGLVVEPIRNSRLVNISYISGSPTLASRAANAVAEKYIAFTAQSKFRTSSLASDSLEKEVNTLRNDIGQLESTMQQYAREHNLYVFEGGQQTLIQNSMSQIMEKSSQATIQRIEKENSYESIKNSEPDALPEVINSKLIQDLKADISRLEQEYNEKSQKFKEDWPPMIQLKEKVTTAKSLLEKERTNLYNSALGSAKREYLEALQVEAGLKRELDKLSKDTQELLAANIKYGAMSSELQMKKKNLEDILKRSSETGITANLENTGIGNIWIVDRAEVPNHIFKPRKKLNVALSVIIGLLLGVGLAFFFEYIDNTLKSIEDVEKYVKLAVLGIVPRNPAQQSQPRSRNGTIQTNKELDLISFNDPKSKTAEAFKELRTSILLSSPDAPPKTFLITSNQPQEGKTFVAVNLAITFTQLGKKVLVIDTDLRKPRIHRIFDLKNTIGISNYLSGNAIFNDIFQNSPIPNLSVITSGPIPPNPAELIDSKNFVALLDYLKNNNEFDHIIFDSPPILSVTDPVILASKIDAVILVIQAARTPRDAATRSKEKLSLVNAKIIGCALNNLSIERSPYYRYGYYYHHYRDEESEGKAIETKKS